jgi:hypothetical protein
VAFTAAYSINVYVSGYQSIDMHCIVLPVKFDGELSISVLRNKQLFKNKWGLKVHIFKKGQTLEKVPLFLDLNSLANGIDNPLSNIT